ncbi:hypothetical protein E4U40_000136 [Claviceps sp. LM458 group G5]|nr:hypothetical protein E4U40_000136 [Claviceps sp. LM458 group G5]
MGSPTIYFNAFANYQYIYLRLFGKEHPDVVVALNRFGAFIMEKSQVYVWSKCIAYAMKHHKSVKSKTIHDAAAWGSHSTIQIETYFTNLDSLLAQSTQKRQRSDTAGASTSTSVQAASSSTQSNVCRKFNTQGGCTFRKCPNRHECSSCGGSHAKPVCSQT